MFGHLLRTQYFCFSVQMLLKGSHVFTFGFFGVLNILRGSFWLIENITYLLLLQEKCQTHFETVSRLPLVLFVHDLAAGTDDDWCALVDNIQNLAEPSLKLFAIFETLLIFYLNFNYIATSDLWVEKYKATHLVSALVVHVIGSISILHE